MKITFHLLLALTVLLQTASYGQPNLSEDRTISESFTKSELADLQLLFDFFNSSICASNDGYNLDSCYLSYLRKDSNITSLKEIEIGISYTDQSKVYARMKDSTFFEIWDFGSSRRLNEPSDTLKMVYLNPGGSYYSFLEKTGSDDPMVQAYLKSVEACGGICPTLIGGLIDHADQWNLADIRIKFLIAIHYLTLNDRCERRERK